MTRDDTRHRSGRAWRPLGSGAVPPREWRHSAVAPPGRQLRDFIHVEDCVRGVVETMTAIDDGDALNLSTGVLTSFDELARTSAEILGYEAMVEALPSKPEGVFARGGDTTKQRKLGFTPRISLRAGLTEAMEHLLASAACPGSRGR
ncbi:MAG TPA: hypothetical protein VMD59_07775 [Acidimicrobiales bacterium]|nr:hypothetical protein [Acidimicrobiales bacterium]